MDQAAAQPRKCPGVDCPNDASTLQCPKCKEQNIPSFFCSQDCFKRSWSEHKAVHKSKNPLRNLLAPKVVSDPDPETGHYNPFPSYDYTGPLRPVYPLSKKREIPKSIPHPEWSESGMPNYPYTRRNKITILDDKGIEAMRVVCRLSREVLDEAAAAIRPGITTDELDAIVHEACIKRNAYPSPLNYNHFPKSHCSSVNEVICHGIPDHRPLEDGDIVNLDISLFHNGYHGDLNETYYVGNKSKANPDNVRLIETTRQCLEKAIAHVKPGVAIKEFGDIIEKHAKSQNLGVIRTYVGHGINTQFHCAPNVPHYAKNKGVGKCAPGMTFTIEPMVSIGSYRDVTWPDNWTSVTVDGKRSAQFEHTLLVTETGVEVLTARFENSPGGPVEMPAKETVTNGDHKS
ncbi:Methionine aminopeptidase 1 [Cyphellophora attinorum]|uniref:Methionine aminopeptidase n=1 Tax=Cyphellophora attinorum TaxID=1664694 RepID=A0A0N0NS46_9EURO|nr:Methionine aminopeptidase 1 [Phialophora attinorum]KPI45579.1 Methionine aminopeptidase 1 [Phialophora attinorum]